MCRIGGGGDEGERASLASWAHLPVHHGHDLAHARENARHPSEGTFAHRALQSRRGARGKVQQAMAVKASFVE